MYDPLNPETEFLAYLDEYIDVSHLIPILHMARRLKFSVKVERDDMITQLMSSSKLVYSKQIRFPDNIYAVNISRGTAATIYHRILSALDYSDRELEAIGEQSSRRYTTINDQKVQFTKALEHLLSLCYTCTSPDAPIMGIHNRLSFEKTYKLRWTDLLDTSPTLIPSVPGIKPKVVQKQQSGGGPSGADPPVTKQQQQLGKPGTVTQNIDAGK